MLAALLELRPAPVISLSTNYEQQPDGSYPQDRVHTRADNPTSEQAERLLAALEGGAEANQDQARMRCAPGSSPPG